MSNEKYSEIYCCVCANVLLNKMKLNIEDNLIMMMEFKSKTKFFLLMTPATLEWKKINAIYIHIGVYKGENMMELGKSGKPVWKNFSK